MLGAEVLRDGGMEERGKRGTEGWRKREKGEERRERKVDLLCSTRGVLEIGAYIMCPAVLGASV